VGASIRRLSEIGASERPTSLSFGLRFDTFRLYSILSSPISWRTPLLDNDGFISARRNESEQSYERLR
jgi:hypothetical protein